MARPAANVRLRCPARPARRTSSRCARNEVLLHRDSSRRPPRSGDRLIRPTSFLHSRDMTGAATGGPAETPSGRDVALEPLMLIDEVAVILGISERGVFRLLSRGELVAVKVG